jgi:hypothetical protein
LYQKKTRVVSADVWQSQPLKLTVPGTQTTATVKNLNPACSYHLRIMAENKLGLSDPSEVIQVTTQEEGEQKPCSSRYRSFLYSGNTIFYLIITREIFVDFLNYIMKLL